MQEKNQCTNKLTQNGISGSLKSKRINYLKTNISYYRDKQFLRITTVI